MFSTATPRTRAAVVIMARNAERVQRRRETFSRYHELHQRGDHQDKREGLEKLVKPQAARAGGLQVPAAEAMVITKITAPTYQRGRDFFETPRTVNPEKSTQHELLTRIALIINNTYSIPELTGAQTKVRERVPDLLRRFAELEKGVLKSGHSRNQIFWGNSFLRRC